MNIRVLKTEEAYREALVLAKSLVMKDPEQGTSEANQLELLTLVIEDFESKNFAFDVPDPVSAIEFRMEEQGLRQRDLIAVLGSRSRVSEVLARKRPLTLPMIRAISDGLGIPAHILVRVSPSQDTKEQLDTEPDWKKFPFAEMQKRGWIPTIASATQEKAQLLVEEFLKNYGRKSEPTFFRRRLRGMGFEVLQEKARYSTFAWSARVLQRAKLECTGFPMYRVDSLSSEYFRKLAMFSVYPDGPLRAIKSLRSIGVCVVVEPRLTNTLIDGAAFLGEDMRPVIGLTLRHDRVDYFWFTLLHELAHVWRHLNTAEEGFIDRVDAEEGAERFEKEANRIARDGLIPRAEWNKSVARLSPSVQTINRFSAEIGVHPAIVAGRLRYETDVFSRFTNLLGQGTVRRIFEKVAFN